MNTNSIWRSRTSTPPEGQEPADHRHRQALPQRPCSFHRVAFRKKIYAAIDDLQADLDLWMREFNETKPHQGKRRFGKAPLQTFLDASPIAKRKMPPGRPRRPTRRRMTDTGAQTVRQVKFKLRQQTRAARDVDEHRIALGRPDRGGMADDPDQEPRGLDHMSAV